MQDAYFCWAFFGGLEFRDKVEVKLVLSEKLFALLVGFPDCCSQLAFDVGHTLVHLGVGPDGRGGPRAALHRLLDGIRDAGNAPLQVVPGLIDALASAGFGPTKLGQALGTRGRGVT